MLFKKIQILLVLSNLVFISTVKADIKKEKEELSIFKVEVVVFETLAIRGWTEEYWPEDIDILDMNDAITIRTQSKRSNMLNKQVKKMTTEKGYKILFHKTWLLRTRNEENAKKILIEATPENDLQSRLEGYVSFYKSNYPHIVINLDLEHVIPEVVKEKFALQQNIPIDELPHAWRFQIKESRKIKSDQLHYIDHPLFGALVQIQWQKELTPK